MHRLFAFLALFTVGLTTTADPAPLPPITEPPPLQLTPYTATYTATFKGLDLKAVRKLIALGDDRYRIITDANHFFGQISENCEFILTSGNQIRPLSYNMNRSVFGISKSQTTQFDWENNVARYKAKDKRREVELQGDELDWLGYQIQLAIDLKAGKKEFNYHIVRRGRSKDYHFEITGEEVLDTPMGKVDTIKLLQVRKDKDRLTEIWVAPDYEYLLVKFHQLEEDGDEYELFLKEVKLNKP